MVLPNRKRKSKMGQVRPFFSRSVSGNVGTGRLFALHLLHTSHPGMNLPSGKKSCLPVVHIDLQISAKNESEARSIAGMCRSVLVCKMGSSLCWKIPMNAMPSTISCGKNRFAANTASSHAGWHPAWERKGRSVSDSVDVRMKGWKELAILMVERKRTD